MEYRLAPAICQVLCIVKYGHGLASSHRRRLWRAGALLSLAAGTLAAQATPVTTALRARLRPLTETSAPWASLTAATSGARVIGLGEATHGQREAFDFKRRFTMELIRQHGVRVVAYEASASGAREVEAYIAGTSDSLPRAMRGFSMLIWAVEENAALLRDLRDWNRTADARNRVRFIGVDAQDGEAVVARLRTLLTAPHDTLMPRIDTLLARAPAATQQMFQGNRAAFEALVRQTDSVVLALQRVAPGTQAANELPIRAAELRAFLTMYGSGGGRDRAMAELLLLQLREGERAVVWGHNAHVMRGPLRHLGSPDLAMGGHLAASLGAAYYALGFTFGAGGFQANAQDSTGRWGFKRYLHGPPPRGSLEATLLQATRRDAFLDVRTVPPSSALGQWLAAPRGFRWWGGYNVPDDVDERTRDISRLSTMTPSVDYDGLLFQIRTSPATPMDRSRIITVSAPRRYPR
jgi:erythromycin esterase